MGGRHTHREKKASYNVQIASILFSRVGQGHLGNKEKLLRHYMCVHTKQRSNTLGKYLRDKAIQISVCGTLNVQ